MATRYFVLKSEEDFKKVEEELTKEKFQLTKLLNQEIEITFTDIETGREEPYSLRITKAFEVVLNSLIKTRLENRYGKVDLKVHIGGTRITMIHHSVPASLTKFLIQKDIWSSYMLIEKKLVSGRRQLVFEFP